MQALEVQGPVVEEQWLTEEAPILGETMLLEVGLLSYVLLLDLLPVMVRRKKHRHFLAMS